MNAVAARSDRVPSLDWRRHPPPPPAPRSPGQSVWAPSPLSSPPWRDKTARPVTETVNMVLSLAAGRLDAGPPGVLRQAALCRYNTSSHSLHPPSPLLLSPPPLLYRSQSARRVTGQRGPRQAEHGSRARPQHGVSGRSGAVPGQSAVRSDVLQRSDGAVP